MQPQRCLRCRSTWTERKLSPRSRQSSGRSRKVVGDCAGGFGFTRPPGPFLALLPSSFASSSSQPPPLTRRHTAAAAAHHRGDHETAEELSSRAQEYSMEAAEKTSAVARQTPEPTRARSEERRVGKECRSRWS